MASRENEVCELSKKQEQQASRAVRPFVFAKFELMNKIWVGMQNDMACSSTETKTKMKTKAFVRSGMY